MCVREYVRENDRVEEVKNRKRKEDKKWERCQFESHRERYYNRLCLKQALPSLISLSPFNFHPFHP